MSGAKFWIGVHTVYFDILGQNIPILELFPSKMFASGCGPPLNHRRKVSAKQT